MQKKLLQMSVSLKITLILLLLIASTFGLDSSFEFVGYLLLFSALYILNEGFGLSRRRSRAPLSGSLTQGKSEHPDLSRGDLLFRIP